MRIATLILASTLPLLGHAGMAEDFQAPCRESQSTMASVRPVVERDGGVASRRVAPERERKGEKVGGEQRGARTGRASGG